MSDETRRSVEAVLYSEAVLNSLAAIEHERWAHWQKYLHEQCEPQADGSLRIPAELVERWKRQLETPFAELPDSEQESDREQVLRYLPTVVDVLS